MARWDRLGGRTVEFSETASDGLAVVAEQVGDVGDPTVAEFLGFEGGVVSAGAFTEGLEVQPHRLFVFGRVFRNHTGVLPRGEGVDYHGQGTPKKPKWGS